MSGAEKQDGAFLEIRDLIVAYQKRNVLQGVSVEVKPGEIVALLGQNGSGKSTLLKTIAGLIVPQSGTIRLSGEVITGQQAWQRTRKGIGYLMQDRGVFPSLTINEHFRLAANSMKASELRVREQIIWRIFPRLEKWRRVRAGLLSGGERQMLAISLLLLRECRLWLLDEPSCGMAPGVVRGLMNSFAALSRERGVTTVLVEQNVREASRIADRVLLLKKGVIEEVSESQLMENLRTGRIPDELLQDINLMARVDQLRKLIQPTDAGWIVTLLDSEVAARRKLALDLTKTLANDPLITAKLKERWTRERDESVVQSLLFALLNVEGLEQQIKNEMFTWIREHWQLFIDSAARWYGGSDQVLDSIRQRTGDESFIEAKHWIYFCCAVASTQREEAREFVSKLTCDSSEFSEEVRRFALSQF